MGNGDTPLFIATAAGNCLTLLFYSLVWLLLLRIFENSLNLTIFPNHEVALKTGTTNDYRDAWAIGYTPSLVVGVWAGNNNNEPMQKRAGSILAAIPMWHDFLAEALKNRTPIAFVRSETIVQNKPMFRGDYVINYEVGGEIYPQIHDILFYVNKNSPQFENWETPVTEWGIKYIPGFLSNYNKPIPKNASVNQPQQPGQLTIKINNPQNGSFIKSDSLLVSAEINSGEEISKVELYLNNSLIDSITKNLGTSYSYRFFVGGSNIELQNLIKIVAFDRSNRKTEEKIIVYK